MEADSRQAGFNLRRALPLLAAAGVVGELIVQAALGHLTWRTGIGYATYAVAAGFASLPSFNASFVAVLPVAWTAAWAACALAWDWQDLEKGINPANGLTLAVLPSLPSADFLSKKHIAAAVVATEFVAAVGLVLVVAFYHDAAEAAAGAIFPLWMILIATTARFFVPSSPSRNYLVEVMLPCREGDYATPTIKNPGTTSSTNSTSSSATTSPSNRKSGPRHIIPELPGQLHGPSPRSFTECTDLLEQTTNSVTFKKVAGSFIRQLHDNLPVTFAAIWGFDHPQRTILPPVIFGDIPVPTDPRPFSASGLIPAIARGDVSESYITNPAKHPVTSKEDDGTLPAGVLVPVECDGVCYGAVVAGLHANCLKESEVDQLRRLVKSSASHFKHCLQPEGPVVSTKDLLQLTSSLLEESQGEFTTVLCEASEKTKRVFRCELCSIFLADGEELWSLADASNPSSDLVRLSVQDARSGIVGRVALTCETITTSDLDDTIMVDLNTNITFRASIATPMMIPDSGKVLGVLLLSNPIDGGSFSHDYLSPVEEFANVLSGILMTFMNLQKQDEEIVRLLDMLHMAKMQVKPRTVPKFVKLFQRQARDHIECENVRLFLISADKVSAQYYYHRSEEDADDSRSRTIMMNGPLQKALRMGKVVTLSVFCKEDAQLIFNQAEVFGVKRIYNMLLCPVYAEDDDSCLAILALVNRKKTESSVQKIILAATREVGLDMTRPSSFVARSKQQLQQNRLPEGFTEFTVEDEDFVSMMCFGASTTLAVLLATDTASSAAAMREQMAAARRMLGAKSSQVHVLTPDPPSTAPAPPTFPPDGRCILTSSQLIVPLTEGNTENVWCVAVFTGNRITPRAEKTAAKLAPGLSGKLFRAIGPGGRRGAVDSTAYCRFLEILAPWTPDEQGRQNSIIRHRKTDQKDGKKFRWRRGEILGRGGFGCVRLAQNADTGELIAVKTIPFNPTDQKIHEKLVQLQNEIQMMKSLSHDAVVAYLGTEREGNNIHIFMEYVPGGSVAHNLKQFGAFSEEVAALYTWTMLQGLDYLHSQEPPVIHRDIKGANLLVTRGGTVKLGDFGSAALLDDVTFGKTTIQGTPQWMSPEVVSEAGPASTYSDIWSVGCTVLEMLTAKFPFALCCSNQLQVMQFVVNPEKDVSKAFPDNVISNSARNFLLKCLQRDTSLRPTCKELLNHAWLSDGDNEVVDSQYCRMLASTSMRAANTDEWANGVMEPEFGNTVCSSSYGSDESTIIASECISDVGSGSVVSVVASPLSPPMIQRDMLQERDRPESGPGAGYALTTKVNNLLDEIDHCNDNYEKKQALALLSNIRGLPTSASGYDLKALASPALPHPSGDVPMSVSQMPSSGLGTPRNRGRISRRRSHMLGLIARDNASQRSDTPENPLVDDLCSSADSELAVPAFVSATSSPPDKPN
eukprot:Sspe_Gene.27598::Locus_11975_Transcript_1_1_Confidence_1.000_Length_4487::g.27598::m.27598